MTTKTLSRNAWALFAALLIATLTLAGCGSSNSGTAGNGDDTGKKGKGKGKGGAGAGAVPVVVASVEKKDVPVEVLVVGSVEAYSTISLKSQIAGQLTNVYFQEGDYVKKDAKLFSIDPRPYQAQLMQDEANVSRSKALLSQAEANLKRDVAQQQYAKGYAERTMKLVDQGIVARETGDQLVSSADALAQTVAADQAAIESARAQIASDEATISNAKVQLGYTTITSPIEGRTGNVTVKNGNIVSANTLELLTINQVEPIYVTFAVPEARLSEIKKYMAGGKLSVVAAPQDGSGSSERGVLTFVDNAVDTTTGTIKLKGTFENTNRALWPGQFVNVTLRLTVQPGAITVPNSAVQNGQDGQFVYVVKEDRSVEARTVQTSSRVGEDLVVSSGLQAGETVVTEGQLRLQPGSRVTMRQSNGERSGAGGGNGAGAGAGPGAAPGSDTPGGADRPKGEGFKKGFKKGEGFKRGEGFKKGEGRGKGPVKGDGPVSN